MTQRLAILLLLPAALAGCTSFHAPHLAGTPPDRAAINAALARPAPPATRTFFATIHVLGQRSTASGIFDFHSPDTFRITAVTELGNLLFDARCAAGTPQVLRAMKGLPTNLVEAFVRDVAAAHDQPAPDTGWLDPRHARLTCTLAGRRVVSTFTTDTDGTHIRRTDVHLGPADDLTIYFTGYLPDGRPREILLRRPARAYSLTLTFTDS